MKRKSWLSFPYALWIAGFVLLPLIFIVIYAFTTRDGSFTFDNVLATFQSSNLDALLVSVRLSLITTIICLLIAYPIAMALNSLHLRKNSTIVYLFILPMWINFLLRTQALKLLLNNNGIINTFLDSIGLGKIDIMYTEAAVIIGLIYDYLPFMLLPIYNSMVSIKKDTIEAARDLGANSLITYKRIILPLTFPGIISGITMVLVPSMTEFAIANILGGGKVLLIGNVIEEEFLYFNNPYAGSGLSIVLMVFILISMAFVNKYDKEGAAIW